jgi:hypothetical protein
MFKQLKSKIPGFHLASLNAVVGNKVGPGIFCYKCSQSIYIYKGIVCQWVSLWVSSVCPYIHRNGNGGHVGLGGLGGLGRLGGLGGLGELVGHSHGWCGDHGRPKKNKNWLQNKCFMRKYWSEKFVTKNVDSQKLQHPKMFDQNKFRPKNIYKKKLPYKVQEHFYYLSLDWLTWISLVILLGSHWSGDSQITCWCVHVGRVKDGKSQLGITCGAHTLLGTVI